MALKLTALGVLGLVASLAAPALAADVPINQEARAHFTAGVNLLQDPDGARYEEAYREFKAAYAASPSWKILGNLGISAMKLERDGEAIEAFRKYLSLGGKDVDSDERGQFQRDLATLEAGVVRLTFDSDPPGATVEDERYPSSGNAIRNAYVLDGSTSIGVRPGRHRFTARLAGRAETVWEVELSPKQQQSYTFKLDEKSAAPATVAPTTQPQPLSVEADKPEVKRGNGLRIGSFVALGIGAVGIGAGTIFGLTAKSRYDEANQLTDRVCGSGTQDCALGGEYESWDELRQNADTAKTLSLVGFIVGGVGVASGVTLLVLSSNKKQEAAAELQPYLGLGDLGVRGRF